MSVIDEIKQRLDIVDFVSEYVTLQKSGKNFKAPCPFHNEKHASFFVFPDRQSWHCFGACGTGGDIFSFLIKRENIDFGQALHILSEKAGVALSSPTINPSKNNDHQEMLFQISDEAAEYFHQLLLNSAPGEIARKYVEKRGISPEIVKTFLLGYSPPGWDVLQQYLAGKEFTQSDMLACGLTLESSDGGYHDRFRNRLMFPIHNLQGRVIGFGARALDDSEPKYLNSPQTLLFDKSSTLYGIYYARTAIRQQNSAIITEGYMDVLTSHQYGWTNTIASMGTSLTSNQLDILRKLTKNIIIALDADMAGEQATMRLASTIDSENYLQTELKVAIPSNSKDPDEEIRENPESWKQALEQATPLIDFILNLSRKKINMDNAKDKSEAVEKLLPLIDKIKDPVRRGHYIQKLSQLLKINERDLIDSLLIRKSKEQKRKLIANMDTEVQSQIQYSSPREEYCLALLLQFPVLRSKSSTILPEYFEHQENREIFLQWQACDIIESINSNLPSILQPLFNKLLNKQLPSVMKDNEEKRVQVFDDCVNNLKKEYLQNLERKRTELLAAETETGTNSGLDKLQEQGLKPAEGLKEIFHTKKSYRASHHRRG